LALVSFSALAQFGEGAGQAWTEFHDPDGRFTMSVPPGWTYDIPAVKAALDSFLWMPEM